MITKFFHVYKCLALPIISPYFLINRCTILLKI